MFRKSSRSCRWFLLGSFLIWAVGFGGCSRDPKVREAKFLETGKRMLAKKDFSRAVLQFKNAASVMPRDAEPYYQLALTYLGTNDFRDAVASLRKCLQLDPKHTGAQLKMAALMAASSDKSTVEEAQKQIQGVLAASPDNLDALDTLAFTEIRLGKVEDAIEHLEKALAKSPQRLQSSLTLAKVRLAQRDLAGAEQVLKKAVAEAPQSTEAALALGQFYLLAGRMPDAQREVERALQLSPRNGPALLSLAAIQIRTNHADLAEQTYQKLSALPDPQYKPLHALFLFQQGKRDAAVAEFGKLARQDPRDRAARTRLVVALLETGKTGEAEKVLAEALQRNAKDTDALLQRGELYRRAGKYTEAETDLRQVLHFQPDSALAHYGLAKVFEGRKAPLQQRQELGEVLRLNPNLLRARIEMAYSFLHSGDAKAAQEIMDATPEAQKKTLAARITRNWALLAQGKDEELRGELDQALALRRTVDLLLQDGLLKRKQKNYAGAQSAFEEALKVSPQDLRPLEALAAVYAAEGKLPLALKRIEEQAAQQPKSALLRLLEGNWLLRAGKPEEARAAFMAAKNIGGDLPAADIAIAQIDLNAGRADAARQLLNSLLARHPEQLDARLLIAAVEEKAGNAMAAMAQYLIVVDKDQNNVVGLNNLAFLLADRNPDEALKYATRASAIAPDNPAIEDTLGWAYYRKGVYDAAVTHLKNANTKEATPRRKYHLAMAYLKNGERDLGRRLLDSALKMDPNLPSTEPNWEMPPQ